VLMGQVILIRWCTIKLLGIILFWGTSDDSRTKPLEIGKDWMKKKEKEKIKGKKKGIKKGTETLEPLKKRGENGNQ